MRNTCKRGRSLWTGIALAIVVVLGASPAWALDLTDTVDDTSDTLTDLVEDTSEDLDGTVEDTGGTLTGSVDDTTDAVEDTSTSLLPRGTSSGGSPSSSEPTSRTTAGSTDTSSPAGDGSAGDDAPSAAFTLSAAGASAEAALDPVVRAAPDQTVSTAIEIGNPYDTEIRVRLRAADLLSVPARTPTVTAVAKDAGTWITFDEPETTIPPRTTKRIPTRVTVPDGTEPGEHPAAIVATLEGDGIPTEEVITPFIIEVTGSASPEFAVDNVRIDRDSALVPGTATLQIELRNTGRLTLRPLVSVNGEHADGPALLLPGGVERYQLTRPLPFWGGPVRFRIEATTTVGEDPGPVQLVRASTFVTPWHLPVLLALGAVAWWLVRRVLRAHGRRARLEAEVRRLERLLAEQREAYRRLASERSAHAPLLPDDVVARLEAQIAVSAAVKQARRAGDVEAARRLEAARGAAGPVSADPR